MTDHSHRIVITGMGVVSPVGLDNRETFDNLLAGRSGVGRITRFDPARLPTRIAAEVKDFHAADYMDRKAARRIGRYAHFSIAAAGEAIREAGLNLQQLDPSRVATLVASAIADFPFLESQMLQLFRKGPGWTNPFAVPRVSTSMASGNVALHYGLTGPGFSVSSACSTGSHALATAWMMLRCGFADVAIAGGAESAITEAYLDSFCALRALSTCNDQPEKASRPFDRTRDGFVMAEGAAVLVLETLAHARQRAANILAELAGIGMSCDAYHITAAHPDGRGASQAMNQALRSAAMEPGQIDYISPHGTATEVNDPIETQAIKTVFGDLAYSIPVRPDGFRQTVKVEPEASNFDQIRAGDKLKVTVTEELVVQMADPGETPATGKVDVVKLAPKGAKPGGVVAQTTQVTATITSIDPQKRTVTLRFRDGSTRTFPVRSDIDLGKHNVGDTVVFRLTEAIALSVKKP